MVNNVCNVNNLHANVHHTKDVQIALITTIMMKKWQNVCAVPMVARVVVNCQISHNMYAQSVMMIIII